MKRRWIILPCIILSALTLFTCIKPFTPKLNDFQFLLVVDALFTDDYSTNYIKLSRTKETLNGTPFKENRAKVQITDDSNNTIIFNEVSSGVYKSANPSFVGEPGKSYTLYIKTADGNEYQSELCTMYEVRGIDSLYFGKDRVILNDGQEQEGVRVYFDSKDPEENKYFRWIYNEWWKFNIPLPKSYVYVSQNNIYEIPVAKVTCWKNNSSNEILVQSAEAGVNGQFIKKPVLFIPSNTSDRLLVQYSIQVKQLSVSKKEYDFWDQMRQINETGGDIFDKQPFRITGNIHNLTNPEVPVLGYFQVSSVKQSRKYITRKEVDAMRMDRYNYPCELLIVGPNDYEAEGIAPPITFDKINWYFTDRGFIFIQPVFDDFGRLERLMFAKDVCADCTLTGSLTKPDFWIDM